MAGVGWKGKGKGSTAIRRLLVLVLFLLIFPLLNQPEMHQSRQCVLHR